MEFWFSVIQYFPQVEIDKAEDYVEIKGALMILQEANEGKVDFTPTIEYLEETYEKV